MRIPAIVADARRTFAQVSRRRRRQLVLLILLMLTGAAAELVTIGAVLPFLTLVTNPGRVMEIGALRPVFSAVGLTSAFEITAAAAGLFALSAIIAAGVRLLLAWASQRFVFGLSQELGASVYRRTLHQPYSYHTRHNSSQTLASINKVQQVANGLMVPLMQAVSGLVIAVVLMAALLIVEPTVALTAGLGFSGVYMLIVAFTRAVMRRNGAVIAAAQRQRVQAANEGLGGIRDILLDRSQAVFVKRFTAVEQRLRRAQATNQFLAAAPRFIAEALGMVLIAAISLALSFRDGGLLAALPTLGALALGAQRLLPILQQIFVGWSAYLTHGQSLRDVLTTLELPLAPQFVAPRPKTPLPFQKTITLEDLSFSYPGSGRPALKQVNVTIPVGSRVGFIGKTGSGKSTLMDLVLGLLAPDSGRVLIDGVELTDANRLAWQAQIAHVPQVIYLSDASVAENIAFGVAREQIDMDRVRRAAEQAELSDVIAGLQQGYDSIVGERGVRLSGGQRQRIGIARALYKQAKVLVFDEATSALDNETERSVMRAIDRLDRSLTILMIAHRLSTVERCDMVIELAAGAIVRPSRSPAKKSS